jgi:tRNA(fMet)-specific endonuclease VapC
MNLLLDTSVIIDCLRQHNTSRTLLYQLAEESHELYISIITHTELYSGKSVWEKEDAQEDLEHVLSGLNIVALDPEISIKAGQLKSVSGIGLIDCIIAATAIQYKLQLVTFNKKHFERIEEVILFK